MVSLEFERWFYLSSSSLNDFIPFVLDHYVTVFGFWSWNTHVYYIFSLVRDSVSSYFDKKAIQTAWAKVRRLVLEIGPLSFNWGHYKYNYPIFSDSYMAILDLSNMLSVEKPHFQGMLERCYILFLLLLFCNCLGIYCYSPIYWVLAKLGASPC